MLKRLVGKNMVRGFLLRGDGVIWYERRLCVLDVYGLREVIMSETHNSLYSVHSG